MDTLLQMNLQAQQAPQATDMQAAMLAAAAAASNIPRSRATIPRLKTRV
jgi:hypothetical protein